MSRTLVRRRAPLGRPGSTDATVGRPPRPGAAPSSASGAPVRHIRPLGGGGSDSWLGGRRHRRSAQLAAVCLICMSGTGAPVSAGVDCPAVDGGGMRDGRRWTAVERGAVDGGGMGYVGRWTAVERGAVDGGGMMCGGRQAAAVRWNAARTVGGADASAAPGRAQPR